MGLFFVLRGVGGDVLEPDLAVRDEPARLVGDAGLPQLLGAALVECHASTLAGPEVSDRRKWVVLVTPTATWPASRTARLAPMLAALSIAVA